MTSMNAAVWDAGLKSLDRVKEEHRIQVHQERAFAGGMLSVTTTYRLLITGDCGLKELERLIRILTVQKQILEEAESDSPGDHQ